jgi:hypothetical protein
MAGLSPAAALAGKRKRRLPYEGGESRMKAAMAA